MQDEAKTRDDLLLELQALRQEMARLKEVQEALEEGEQRYRTLFEASTDAVFLETLEGRVLDCNTAACEMFGYSKEEFLGLTVADLAPADVAATLPDIISEELSTGGAFFEAVNKRKDGKVFPVEVNTQLITLAGEQRAIVYVRDITERKRSEEALRRRADELDALQSTVLDITVPHDLPTLLETIVERAVRLLGAPSGGLYLCHPKRQQVECVVSYKTPRDYRGIVLQHGEGAAGTVAQTGQPLIVDDYRTWDGQAAALEGEIPFRAVAATPMIWQSQVIGVIDVMHYEEDIHFAQADLDLLTLFANHAAIAVQNTRLFEQAQAEIGQRKELEQQSRERRLYFESLVNCAPDAIIAMNAHHQVLEWNPGAQALFGYTPEEAIGRDLDHLIASPIDRTLQEAVGLTKQALSGKPVPPTETVRYRKDGCPVDVILAGAPILAEGNVVGTVAVYTDITERKRAEQALRESEQKFRNIVESSPLGMHMYQLGPDDRLIFIDANPAADQILGVDNAQFIGQTIEEAFPALAETQMPEKYRMVASTGQPWRKDEFLYEENQVSGAFEIYAFQTSPNRMAAAFLDVTERKRSEEAVRKSEELFRLVFEHAPIGMAVTGLDGQYLRVNQALCDTLGYTAEELVGRTFMDLSLDEDLPANLELRQKTIEGEISSFQLEKRFVAKTGGIVHTLLQVTLVRDAQDQPLHFIGQVVDITKRRQALYEVQQLKEFNEGIVQNMAEGIVVQDAEGDLIFVNPAAAAMLGYGIEELLGKHWTLVIPADQRTIVEEADRLRAQGESSRYQLKLVRKDGTRFPVLVSGSPRFREGNFEGSLAVFTDISERVQAEEQLTRRAREMAALYETSLEINAQPDLSTLLNAIVRRATGLAGVKMGGLYLMRPGSQELELVVSHNLPVDHVGATLRLGEGLSGQIAQTGEPLSVPDYRDWEGKAEIYADYPFRRVLGIPLKVGEQVIGVINVTDDEQSGLFDKEAVRLVGLFADQAAIAVENARLFEAERAAREQAETAAAELRARERHLTLLNAIRLIALESVEMEAMLQALVDQMGDLFTADACYITLWDEARQTALPTVAYGPMRAVYADFQVEPGETTMTESVLQAGHALIVDNIFDTPYLSSRIANNFPAQSLMGLPLIADGQKLGATILAFDGPHQFTPDEIARGEQAAGQIALAIAKARLLETEREQRELAEALRQAASAVGSTLDLEETLDQILEQVDRVVPNDAVSLSFIEGEEAHIVRSRGYRRLGQDVHSLVFQLAETPNLLHIVTTGQSLVISDTRAYPGWIQMPEAPWVRSYAGAPIRVRDRIIGFLSTNSATPGFFNQAHADRLQAFADQAGLAIENARLFKEMSRRVEYLNTLNRTGLAIAAGLDLDQVLDTLYDQIRRIMDVGAFYVALYNEDTGLIEFPLLTGVTGPGHIEPLHIEQQPGITGYVITSKQPLYVPDTHAVPEQAPYHFIPLTEMSTRSYIGVPLIVRENVIGVLSAQSYEPNAYTQADVEMLMTVASQASVAIDNAQLFQIVERGKREWEATFDAMQDAVVLVDHKHRILRANLAFANLVQQSLYDVIQQDYAALVGSIPPGQTPPLPDADQPATWIHEYRDRVFEVQSTSLPESNTDEPAHTGGHILVMRDISERRQAEEEIRRRNRELALLNRVIAASAASLDTGAILDTVCRELAQAFDTPQSVAALFDEDKTQAVIMAQYGATEQPPSLGEVIPIQDSPSIEYLLRHKRPLSMDEAQTDPRLATFHDLLHRRGTMSLLLLPLIIEREVIGSLGVDSVEPRTFSAEEVDLGQRVAEQVSGALARTRLEETQRRLSAAVEQAAEAIFITETDGTILYVNPAFERLSGYSRAEVIGQTPRLLKSGEHNQSFYQNLWQTIKSGQAWQGRFINRRKDGSLFTEDATITPVRNQAGEVVNFVTTMRDVTREVELEEQFYHAQKMEALGQMAGGIAHDFNNLLTVIHLSTRILQRQLRPEDPLWEHVQRIRETGDRATRLTKQLLSFSRREVVEPEILNLNLVVEDLSRMLQRIIGENIELVIDLAQDLWPVEIDPSQMEQIIMNLVVNARDAMPKGGTLTIETGNITLDEAYAATHVDAQPGEHVVLSVHDTGMGMSERVRSHLFEPFFTTKDRGQGTGLGLPTVFGIVKQNQGHIRVKSEIDAGTTIQIFLPSAGKGQTPRHPPLRPLSPATSKLVRGTETVLITEDEQGVRDLAVQVLKSFGYRVLAARDGAEALQISQQHEGPIHLLLTDVVMPQMNGRELAGRLLAQRPETRILYMSGYADDAITERGMLPRGTVLLSKPLTIEELTQKVRAVLDGRL